MIKKIALATAVVLGLVSTPALALDQFYRVESGQWTIEGYTGEKNFCSAKTYWSNGSYVSLFNMRNSEEFSIIVHNTDWNISGNIGSYYDAQMSFSGNEGTDFGDAPFELLDSQTIAFRDITSQFLENWIKYRTMKIIMPNDIPNMSIGLRGTSDATVAFVDCIDHLNK